MQTANSSQFEGVESYWRLGPDLMFFRVTKGEKVIELMVNQECFDFYKRIRNDHLHLNFSDPTLDEITKLWFFELIHSDRYGRFVSSNVYEEFHK